MGKKLELKPRKTLGETIQSVGTVGGTESGTGADRPRPADAGGTGTGTAGTAGTGKPAVGKTEKEKPAVVAVVTADENTTPAEKPAEKKPKKVRRSPKKKETTVPAEQVDALLMAMSGMIAARPGCEHWAISQQEAHSVSVPLCNILDKSGFLQSMGENADAVALTMAAVTIIVPRAMITAGKIKEEKKRAKTGQTVDVAVKSDNKKAAVAAGSQSISVHDAGQSRNSHDVPRHSADLSFLGGVVG